MLKKKTHIEYLATGSPEDFELIGNGAGGAAADSSVGALLLLQKTKQFLRAVTGPRVSREIREQRLAICATCPKQIVQGKARYCGACSCPKWGPAELKRKSRLKRAECPLGKWPTK